MNENRDFAFDAVFPECARNADVFERIGAPVVEDCLKGYHGTIVAYGQTGSGKTHSLLQDGEDAGIFQRLALRLFERVSIKGGFSHTIAFSAVQIYNEQADDLLHVNYRQGKGHNLTIHSGGDIPGLTWKSCENADEMITYLALSRSNVVLAETSMNKMSSRSHAVLQIRINKVAEDYSPTSDSRRAGTTGACLLTVVDLAGSERTKKSGVDGVHLKEASLINKSLLAFGNVVNALATKKSHVPVRESKLTRILEGSIGGNCKTVLLVCLSLDGCHVQESLGSLELGARAMGVEVDAKPIQASISEPWSQCVHKLEAEVEGLKKLMKKALPNPTHEVDDHIKSWKAQADLDAIVHKTAEYPGTIRMAPNVSTDVISGDTLSLVGSSSLEPASLSSDEDAAMVAQLGPPEAASARRIDRTEVRLGILETHVKSVSVSLAGLQQRLEEVVKISGQMEKMSGHTSVLERRVEDVTKVVGGIYCQNKAKNDQSCEIENLRSDQIECVRELAAIRSDHADSAKLSDFVHKEFRARLETVEETLRKNPSGPGEESNALMGYTSDQSQFGPVEAMGRHLETADRYQKAFSNHLNRFTQDLEAMNEAVSRHTAKLDKSAMSTERLNHIEGMLCELTDRWPQLDSRSNETFVPSEADCAKKYSHDPVPSEDTVSPRSALSATPPLHAARRSVQPKRNSKMFPEETFELDYLDELEDLEGDVACPSQSSPLSMVRQMPPPLRTTPTSCASTNRKHATRQSQSQSQQAEKQVEKTVPKDQLFASTVQDKRGPRGRLAEKRASRASLLTTTNGETYPQKQESARVLDLNSDGVYSPVSSIKKPEHYNLDVPPCKPQIRRSLPGRLSQNIAPKGGTAQVPPKTSSWKPSSGGRSCSPFESRILSST